MNARLVRSVVVTLVAYVGSVTTLQASGTSLCLPDGRNASAAVAARGKAEKEPRLEVHVTPLVVLRTSDAQGWVTVPRDRENRLLRVILESESYFSSSDIQLDGADAARTHPLYWKGLPPGRYRVTVELYGPAGLRDSTHAGALER
jgi:hypothetical protein